MVSQPSLSFQIQKAESQLGYLLFDRGTKPILPTEKGARFLAQARVVLTEYQDLISEKATLSGRVILGSIPTIGSYLLPDFLSRFTRRYPDVEIIIHEEKTDQLIEHLLANTIDVALLATDSPHPRLAQIPLFDDPFWIYTSMPDAFDQPMHPEMLHHHPIWLLGDGHCFRDQVLDMCSRGNRLSPMPSVQFVGGSLETLINMIEKNGGTTIIPALALPTLRRDAGGQFIPFQSPAPHRQINLTHRARTAKLDVIQAIWDTLMGDDVQAGLTRCFKSDNPG
jgi:LysR family hydrogen peroxide-inducible transcriptional activator